MYLSWSLERMRWMLFLCIIVYIHGKQFSLYSCGQLWVGSLFISTLSVEANVSWECGHFRILLSIWKWMSPDLVHTRLKYVWINTNLNRPENLNFGFTSMELKVKMKQHHKQQIGYFGMHVIVSMFCKLWHASTEDHLFCKIFVLKEVKIYK